MSEAEQTKVFISYRRHDTKAISRLIYETLCTHFGVEHVFFDIDSIPIGEDFQKILNEQVAQCTVLLAVIGEKWTQGTNAFTEDDFVRIEICAALEKGIPVIPILADGAGLPSLHQVPDPSLHPFLRRNGLPVDSGRDFRNHMTDVTRHAERLAGEYVAEQRRRAEERQRAAEQARRDEAAKEKREAERPRHEEQTNRTKAEDMHKGAATLPESATAAEPPQQKYRALQRLESGDGLTELLFAELRGIEGFRRRVLVRRPLPQLVDKYSVARRFLDEVRLSGHLSHANIHALIDVGHVDNSYFCTYEYLDFEELKQVMEARRPAGEPIDLSLACYICKEVCRGLEYAHAATDVEGQRLDVVHGNVAPYNIYLVRDGRVMLGGFGLAGMLSQLDPSDSSLVNFSYLSPEQITGGPLDCRSDLFAVGVVLWEMVAGRQLFFDASVSDALHKIQMASWPPLRQVQPGYRGELDEVLPRLLAKDPNQRYADAKEVREAFEAVLRRSGAYVGQDDVAKLVNESRGERRVTDPDDGFRRIAAALDQMMLDFQSPNESAASEGAGAPDRIDNPIKLPEFEAVDAWAALAQDSDAAPDTVPLAVVSPEPQVLAEKQDAALDTVPAPVLEKRYPEVLAGAAPNPAHREVDPAASVSPGRKQAALVAKGVLVGLAVGLLLLPLWLLLH